MQILPNTIKFAIGGVIGAPLPTPIIAGVPYSVDITMSGSETGYNEPELKSFPTGWGFTRNGPIVTLSCQNPQPEGFNAPVFIIGHGGNGEVGSQQY